jgi:hypothetical protein
VQPIRSIIDDIPNVLNKFQYNTKIYTLIGKSECNDYKESDPKNLFLDTLHIGAIINCTNVTTMIFNAATHRLLSEINIKILLETICNEFDTFFDDQKKGNALLQNIPYFKIY